MWLDVADETDLISSIADVAAVVPTLNEAPRIARLVRALYTLGVGEVIVADGGSRDDTLALARAAGAEVLVAPPGRGAQLRIGVAATTRPAVWIVHADARLPANPWPVMAPVLAAGDAGAFRLRIDHPAPVYRIIEWGVRVRVAITNIPYGDQGMFLPRSLYESAGGFRADHPIMEDVALARAVHAKGRRWRIVSSAIGTDARRWQRQGPLRRTLGNAYLMLRYCLLGADPQQLATAYRPEPQDEVGR